MGDIWAVANIAELEFAATATLLAIKARQKSLLATQQPENESGDESDSDDDQDDEERTTSEVAARLTTSPRHTLIERFLDRLGEVFAREKSSVRLKGRGSKHVAATAWIESGAKYPLTIISAKNGGLDDRDRKMGSNLQVWFRTVAATGRTSSVMADRIWVGDIGLVEYSRSRLWYHISQINELDQVMKTLAVRAEIYGPVITCLEGLCQKATTDSTVQQLSDIVNIAYILRKVLRSIDMLGRLRAAYECFKTTALSFDEVSTMEMTPITLSQPMEINETRFRKSLERLAKEYGVLKGRLKNQAAQKYMGASQLYLHAEMQILLSIVANADWHSQSHGYVGISKKSCFLCDEILQKYKKISVRGIRKAAFKARCSHGKVYPLWTLPPSDIVPVANLDVPVAHLAMASAVVHAYHQVQQYLQHELVLQAAIAESSVGVTEAVSISGDFTRVKRQYLASQWAGSSSESVDKGKPPITLGRKLKSVRVGLLPADGSKPGLIPINFHALPKRANRRIRESGYDYVPDFHDSWGESQFDRRFRILTLENQPIKELEGNYRLYWNENHDLPENGTIKHLLGLGGIDIARRFWYGDIFIVRFSEHPKTFAYDVHDTPIAILEDHRLDAIFQNMWEEQFLEEELESDHYHEGHAEKIEADKEIILQRMTPIERDVLSRLPPNTLEYLALTACDDGAVRDVSIEKDPHNPSMMQIRFLKGVTAQDSMGWQGFQSSQL